MSDNNQNPVTTTTAADPGFQIVIGEPTAEQLPAVVASTTVALSGAGGLSYANANDAEHAEMDKIIAGIDLNNPDTIVTLGKEERERLAGLADQILDSIQPNAKLEFAKALKALIEAIQHNSLDEIKKRLSTGKIASIGKGLLARVSGHNPQEEATKEYIGNFMTDISGSRKTISEMTDKLKDQQTELARNFVRINELGAGATITAQRMRIVRAAVAEFIRKVDSGENPILSEMEKQAQRTGRTDDNEKLQTAQANWNLVRTIDGDLLASIGVYDMSIGNLAFTKQANYQNRVQTEATLTTTIAEWKIQLATFAVVTTENAAAQLLNVAGQLTTKSVQANVDLFDTLVASISGRAAKGTYNLKQIIEAQGHMSQTLSTVGQRVEAQFDQLAADKKALEGSSDKFRESMRTVYSKGHLGVEQPGRPALQVSAAGQLPPPAGTSPGG